MLATNLIDNQSWRNKVRSPRRPVAVLLRGVFPLQSRVLRDGGNMPVVGEPVPNPFGIGALPGTDVASSGSEAERGRPLPD